jgi:polar amino acid transport system substrate-binding protein
MTNATRWRCAQRLSILLLALPLAAQTPAALIAPTGTLRAAFLGDNPALGKVDAKTGTVTGPVADFVQEFARRLGVPYQLIPCSGARDISERLNAGSADLGFFAYNAGRAKEVDFSPAWLLMPNTYIVRADSPIRKVADADRAGVHIQAVKGDTQDVYLSNNLKNTKVDAIAAMPSPQEIETLLLDGKIDALAANRQRLELIGSQFPKLRVVADDYFVAAQSIAIAKGNPARLEAVNKVLDEILATSVIKDSIARGGLRGVNAAPPKTR